MIDFIGRFISALSDAELTYLKNYVYGEENRRMIARIEKGDYPELTHFEKELVMKGTFIEAIKAYRTRCNVGLKEAKDVIEAFRGHVAQMR